MSIKEKINVDYISALKEKNTRTKLALGNLKTKITESEKNNSNNELTDDDVIKIVNKLVKQRQESIKLFTEGGRLDLVENEKDELDILSAYLPEQMSEESIKKELLIIMESLPETLNQQARLGKTIGEFNKKFNGMVNIDVLKTILNNL